MIRVYIPHWHPTPLNRLKGHWAVAARMKKADRQMVAAYFAGQPKAERKRRRQLTIILAPGRRKCDPDAYDKALNDALVHAGALVNDSDNWLEISPVKYERGSSSTDWGSLIELTDL